MKNSFPILVFFCMFSSTSLAVFDLVISDTYYNGTITLDSDEETENYESLLVTGAGVYEIEAYDFSYVEVQNTLPLETGVGGIRRTKLYNDSNANVSGGEFDYIGTYDNSALTITGGSVVDAGFVGDSQINMSGGHISGLFFQENATINFSNGEIRWFGIYHNATATFSGGSIDIISCRQNSDVMTHIKFICDVESVFHNTDTNILTGNWLDGSSFSIQLVDIDGYSPAIENILFIPEPATLILITLGAVIIRKR